MAAENNTNVNIAGVVQENAVISESINLQSDEFGNFFLEIPGLANNTQSGELDELLEQFNLKEVKDFLTKAEITYGRLRYLSKDDIKEAIPPIGLRAEFREKLFSWRKNKYGIDDEYSPDSCAGKVISWLQKESNFATKSTPTSSHSAAFKGLSLSKSLPCILEESLEGKAIINFYKNNGNLIDSFRSDLINIILEDIFYHDAKLSPKDCPTIIDDILEIFPNEIKEYYFIPRGKKKNPGGKLWDKYVNQKAKRSRPSYKFPDNLRVTDSTSQPVASTEFDEAILQSLKASLARDFSNWDEVKDKWQRTFLLRRKDLKTSETNYEFLKNWPLYTNAKAHELINIDFDLLYPNKSHLLFSKWDEFSQKIGNYYATYIKDKKSIDILVNSKKIKDKISLISRLLIVFLIYKEVMYYKDANLKYQFEPDINTEKVQMHVDITVAMPCSSLSGVDLMDETQQDVFAYGTLQRQGVWWDLPMEERVEFERHQFMNHFRREQYHSIADILFKDMMKSNEGHEQPLVHSGKPVAEEQYDACRLHGTLGINKVAGVLHLVGGAMPVVDLFGDHFMIGFRRVPANFTHRINRLSFGQFSKHIVQPLEGDEVFISEEETTIQYFLNIVPTEIHKTFSTINTYQYSVTENKRALDPAQNSYGNPGIYFKYDWSALKIVVRTDRDNLIQFIIRLCSIISGIIVISGILNSLLVNIQKCFIHTVAPELLHKRLKETPEHASLVKHPKTLASLPATALANDLIINANKMSAQVASLVPKPKTKD